MRRIVRYIFLTLAVVPLLAVLVFWYRSTDTEDCIGYRLPGERCVVLTSETGQTVLETYQDLYWAYTSPSRCFVYSVPFPGYCDWVRWYQIRGMQRNFAGFTVAWGDRVRPPDGSTGPFSTAMLSTEGYGYALALPYWFLALLALVFPALFLRKPLRRYRRARRGLCLECGYDIRASSLRCPECGAALSPRAKRMPIA